MTAAEHRSIASNLAGGGELECPVGDHQLGAALPTGTAVLLATKLGFEAVAGEYSARAGENGLLGLAVADQLLSMAALQALRRCGATQ